MNYQEMRNELKSELDDTYASLEKMKKGYQDGMRHLEAKINFLSGKMRILDELIDGEAEKEELKEHEEGE